MSSQLNITVAQVRARASDKSFERGESYYRGDAILHPARRGSTIEGQCEGSQARPYRVSATLDADGIKEASCTCDYDFGGDCKHIVALLLTYINQPELFEDRQPVEDVLAQREKSELIALIRQMVKRYPDLQTLVDRPIASKQSRKTPLDTNSFRKELRYAFKNYGDEWGDDSAQDAIESVRESAQDFAVNEDWLNASAILRVIIEETLVDPNLPLNDHNGEIIGALNGVLDDLGECLSHLADKDGERQAIINSMLDCYIWDVEFAGGVGLGESESGSIEDIILQYAREPDIAPIRQRIREARQRKSNSAYGRWGAEAFEGFLIDLDLLDNVDPEATLQRLRDDAQYVLLVGRLIEMKRVPEAITVIREFMPVAYERARILPYLSAAGYDDEAVQLAEETVKTDTHRMLTDWLLQRYYARNDQQKLFEFLLRQMKKEPSVEQYRELKRAAETRPDWANTHGDLVGWLEKQRKYEVLTRLHLHDENFEAAWKTLALVPKSTVHNWMYTSSLEFEVAEKSRNIFPERALPVYIQAANKAIAGRTRDTYRQAASYLQIAQELHQKMGDTAGWQKLIDDIRYEFKKLPALQDELKRARL
jgi:uncharacterized Zn finger protein